MLGQSAHHGFHRGGGLAGKDQNLRRFAGLGRLRLWRFLKNHVGVRASDAERAHASPARPPEALQSMSLRLT